MNDAPHGRCDSRRRATGRYPRGVRIYDLVIPDHPGAHPSSVTDEQLARWAAEPVGTQRSMDDALGEVRRALSQLEVDYGELELFVQGGYANRTAVTVQADIDIVVRWLALPVSEIIEDPEDSTALAYRVFRDAVLGVLRSQLDPGVRDPRIACRCELATGKVDVVPCLPFRPPSEPERDDIWLWPDAYYSQPLVSWPRMIHALVERRDRETHGHFRPAIRALKGLLSGASFRDVVVTVVRHEGSATK